MTHTLAKVVVSKDVFYKIRMQLRSAGYEAALRDDENMLDMTGLAIVWRGPTLRTQLKQAENKNDDTKTD